jgi:hypothetical protein
VTDLSQWNPDSAMFQKFVTQKGTFYRTVYGLQFTLSGTKFSVETVFAANVVRKCHIDFD